MSKQLAIMREPNFGMRDMGQPGFWFGVDFGEDLRYSALIIMNIDEFSKQVKDMDIYDMKKLKGRPCQIEVEGNIVKFVGIL